MLQLLQYDQFLLRLSCHKQVTGKWHTLYIYLLSHVNMQTRIHGLYSEVYINLILPNLQYLNMFQTRQNELFCPSFCLCRNVEQHLYAHTHSQSGTDIALPRAPQFVFKINKHRIRFLLVIASPENIVITFLKGNSIN